MEQVQELLPLALTMLATGAFAGVMAGLLGVGGGIVIVPVLDTALELQGVDPAIRMHLAVATSLATIIPTSISSALAHHRKGAVDFPLVRFWGPFILVGSVCGTLLASRLDGSSLSLVFGVVALLVAIKMMIPMEGVHLTSGIKRGPVGATIPFGIGGISSMMGIGGGSLSVPAMTLMAEPIHKAVATSAVFGLCIALPGALAFVASGWGDARLPPGSLGFVNLIGFLFIAPTTVLFAPLGAKLAHRLSQRHLSLVFGVFLLVVSVRMLLRMLG